MVFTRQQRNRFRPYSLRWPQKPLKRKNTAGKLKEMQQTGELPNKIFGPWISFSEFFLCFSQISLESGKEQKLERGERIFRRNIGSLFFVTHMMTSLMSHYKIELNLNMFCFRATESYFIDEPFQDCN